VSAGITWCPSASFNFAKPAFLFLPNGLPWDCSSIFYIAVDRRGQRLVWYDTDVLKFEGSHVGFLPRSPFLCLRLCVEHLAERGKSLPPNPRTPTLANFLECRHLIALVELVLVFVQILSNGE
jgi:hypothetical protein